jgi:hypothetical protein
MMDPSALEKKMLEAAIAASLQDFQKQARQSSSQSSSQTQDQSRATQSGSKTPSKSSSQAANPQMMPDQPRRSPQLPQPLKSQVVDLTNDSSSDSDLQEIFPKSKSVIGSDTDAEIVEDAEDDDSDEDLKRAIAMSLEGAQHSAEISDIQGPASHLKPVDVTETTAPVTPNPQGIFGMDRKQMEQERLARLAKRKAGSSPLSTQPAQKTSKITDLKPSLNARAPLPPKTSNTNVYDNFAANDPTNRVQPTPRPVMQYPLGAVKKTHVAYSPRTGNDITIEEVFQREDLKVAVLSSFLWDIEWLFSKFDTKKTKFILIMGAKEEATVSRVLSWSILRK